MTTPKIEYIRQCIGDALAQKSAERLEIHLRDCKACQQSATHYCVEAMAIILNQQTVEQN